jgi:quercetin dioxygenase-like cupin family protein
MNRLRTSVVLMAVVFAVVLVLSPFVGAQEKSEIKRNILAKQDLATVPGHEGVLAQVEIPVGGAEPRHTHPGEAFGYVQEGTLTLNIEGKPVATVKPGESFFIPANTVHWGVNQGTAPVKVLATFVVPKGQPMTSPAK